MLESKVRAYPSVEHSIKLLNIRLGCKRPARNKHPSLLGLFLIFEENEVFLCIMLLSFFIFLTKPNKLKCLHINRDFSIACFWLCSRLVSGHFHDEFLVFTNKHYILKKMKNGLSYSSTNLNSKKLYKTGSWTLPKI